MEELTITELQEPSLNSVIELNPDALAIADALDAEQVPRGPLHGVPVLLKDNIAPGLSQGLAPPTR